MLKISIIGLGLMGKQHLKAINEHPNCKMASIIDHSDEAKEVATSEGCPFYQNLTEAIVKSKPDGLIIATPNARHFEDSVLGLKAGIPILIEKPISDSLMDAEKLIELGKKMNVPILTGYHRRHNPINFDIKKKLLDGFIGDIVAMHGMFWLYKPDDYFDQAWRKIEGAGPIYINLSHDIDLMRHFLGEIESVQAVASNKTRGFDVEDTSVAILNFQSGVIGSISISDTIVSPWSYELTSNENPAYHHTTANCYWIGGTDGSIELPNGTIWSHEGHKSWWEPISSTTTLHKKANPIFNQIDNFINVIRGEDKPLVSGLEGLKTSAVIDAIKLATQTRMVEKPKF
ncbi:MAG: Gfo/Idh/MocA family oxidoreductase [Paracoccaceae bacterium]|nr:Gfo/Idh/MocA family oxidoreductase [Paracoccaceae bacterium]